MNPKQIAALQQHAFNEMVQQCKAMPNKADCPAILKQAGINPALLAASFAMPGVGPSITGLVTGVIQAVTDSAKQPTSFLAQVATKSGSLNLRRSPKTTAPILAKLKRGTTGMATPVSKDWMKFESGVMVGYVASKFIRAASIPAGIAPVGLQTGTIDLTGGYTGNSSAPPQSSGAIAGAGSYGAKVCTKSTPLMLRRTPSTTGVILAKMPKGTLGVATPTTSGKWVKFKIASGTVGYASSKYICRATSAGALLSPPVGTKAGKSVSDKLVGLSKYRTHLLVAGGLLGTLLVAKLVLK